MNCSYLKTQKNSLRKVFAVLLFSLFSAFTFGAAYTWKGTVDTDWNNASNWEGGTVPTSGAEVEINKTGSFDPVYPGNTIFSKLTIEEGNRLDIGLYKISIKESFTCMGTLAVDMDNPSPVVKYGTGNFTNSYSISWGDDSFLELYSTSEDPEVSEFSIESSLYKENKNIELVGNVSFYQNLFINLPGKTYKPKQNKLYVTGKLKLQCDKILTTENQDYQGLVTLLSDVIFDCKDSGSIKFTNSNQQTENVKTVISESENGEFTYSATFKGKRVQFGAGLGLKNLTVESDEIVFYSTKTASYSVETTQKQIYKHAINLNCNDNDVSQVTMTFKAEDFEMHNGITTTGTNGLSKYVVVFDTPVKLFDNTTINCKGITFNKDIICNQAGYKLTLTGCSGSDIEFYGNIGQDNKLNNFDITTRGGCSLYIGQNGTPVNIKAQSFSFKDSTSPAIKLYGTISTDNTINFKGKKIYISDTTLTSKEIMFDAVTELTKTSTIKASDQITFTSDFYGSGTDDKIINLKSTGENPVNISFGAGVGYEGSSEKTLTELNVTKVNCTFAKNISVKEPLVQDEDSTFIFKGNIKQTNTAENPERPENKFSGNVTFNNDEGLTLTFNRPVVFGSSTSNVLNFNPTGTTERQGTVIINTNNCDCIINSKIVCNKTGVTVLNITSGTGNISINNNVGSQTTYLGNITLDGNTVTVAGNMYGKAITAKVNELYEQKAEKTIWTYATDAFTQSKKSDAANAIVAGTIEAEGILFASDVYIKEDATLNSRSGTLGFSKNVYIASSDSGNTKFNFSGGSRNITVAKNFVLCGGTLDLGGNLTVAGDLLLLGHDNSIAYSDCYGDAEDLFSYFNAKRTGKGYTTNVSLPTAFPDSASTAFPAKDSWNASITNLGGRTITVKKNFYDNGVNLNPTAKWTLYINENKSYDFIAEAYNAKIGNSIVKANSSETKPFAKIAASDCENEGNNKETRNISNLDDANLGWDFEPLLITSAKTISDDILCIEFNQYVENSHNEISSAFDKIKYNNGSKAFAGIYKDAACSQTFTASDKNVKVVYLKTASGQENRWNTDATGSNAGNEQSTDRGRTGELPKHSTVVPDITIERATAALFETLRDDAKNRIKLYKGDDPYTGRYTGTTDGCSPVLIAVYTGQELHTPYGSTADSQPQYDAHNFIEFQYSEAVDVGSITKDKVNVKATDSLGKITSASSGITVAGIASIANGKVECGQRNSSDDDGTTVHSLYRKFKQTAADAEDTEQSHRVRIAVAGYADGTITVDGLKYNNWKGYIKNAVMPSGNITRIVNESIKDVSGNVLDSTGDSDHELPQLTVNDSNTVTVYTAGISSENTLYETWDLSRPHFAVWFYSKQPWSTGANLYKNADGKTVFEIIGSSGAATGTEAKCIEFHIFDNDNDYSSSTPHYILKTGWADADNDILEYSFDVAGGSRANIGNKTKANRTGGGLRRASFENADKAFKYSLASSGEITDSRKTNVSSKPFSQKVYNELLYSKVSTTACPSADSLYFEAFLSEEDQEKGLPVSQQFKVYFDEEKSFITDLAGNLLCGPEKSEMFSLDITPPQFALSVAAVGKNEMYILFSKKLGSILNNLGILRDNLELVKMNESTRLSQSAASPDSGLAFDSSSLPVEIFDNAKVSCIKFKLNKNVTVADIENTWVRVKHPVEQSLDTQTGLFAYISPIQDDIGNAMAEYSVHALSDFAVNVVNPLNAYAQTNNTLDPENPVMLNTITKFKPDDKGNTLPTESDIHMQAEIVDGEHRAIAFFSSRTSSLESDQYNRQTGEDLKIWLPQALPSFTSKAVVPDVEAGLLSSVPDEKNHIEFVINGDEYNWLPGRQIQFVFGLTNADGNLITIDNDGNSSTSQIPLYALRLKNENDITSLDLWQFRTLGVQKQRGNVIIRNNVINVAKNDKTIIQIDMEEQADVKVAVMTVDGKIIKYLHNGSLNRGSALLEWEGKNQSGKYVARGLYFIRIAGGGIDETRKVIVVK